MRNYQTYRQRPEPAGSKVAVVETGQATVAASIKTHALKFANTATAQSASIPDRPPEGGFKQIVFAEVYAPMRPDCHGEYMTAEDIEVMAHEFLRSGKTRQIDLKHDNELVDGACIIESFIAREGDLTFIVGSWVVGVEIINDVVWQMILDGEINGFSMEAWVVPEEHDLTLEVPPTMTGICSTVDGHNHTFHVTYSDEGEFLGGYTSTDDGHAHMISTGTATQFATTPDGCTHKHTFSMLDQVELRED